MPGRDGTAASSGTVNTYYPPDNGTYTTSSTSIPLGSRQGATTEVAPGDLVVVMQMQCATINTTNSNNYGAGNGTGRGYTDPSGSCLAGRYQYVRAGRATTNNSVDLSGSPLAATYVQDATTATNRRTFQVIRVPQHSTLTLTGTVDAPRWNGSTGGVVVLDVAGALNWNGQTVDVAGRGFRGGGAINWNGNTSLSSPPDHVTAIPPALPALTTDNPSPKGEGLAGTPRYLFNPVDTSVLDNGATWGGYLGGDLGRGAPGNAGGGGNNRDGGRDNGGGVGNGGVGGFGAYGWKGADWGGVFTTSDFDLRGIGGAAFSTAAPDRVVMAGGGGAGGTNNSGITTVASNGGAGGGVVVVRAGTMSGTGSVNANGAVGQTNHLNDGSGGGWRRACCYCASPAAPTTSALKIVTGHAALRG